MCWHTVAVVTVLVIFGSVSDGGLLPQSRIVNGSDSPFLNYVAKVVAHQDGLTTQAGGTFISHRHVLTTGHVIYHNKAFEIYFGSTTNALLQYVEVLFAVYHPDFDPERFTNDIGIIATSPYPTEGTGSLGWVNLPCRLDWPTEHQQGLIVSFGYTSIENGFEAATQKQAAKQTLVLPVRCETMMGNRRHLVASTHFCAIDSDDNGVSGGGGGDASLCVGDQGSGFVLPVNGQSTVFGVASVITNMCSNRFPVMYTHVAPYLDWINEVFEMTDDEEFVC